MVAMNYPTLEEIFPCPDGYREIEKENPPKVGEMLLDRSSDDDCVEFCGFDDDGQIIVKRGELEWREKANWFIQKV